MLADDFLKIFDRFSISSNDLTQLTLGHGHRPVNKAGKYVGICGQGPTTPTSPNG